MQGQIGFDTGQEGQEYDMLVIQLLSLLSKKILLDRERIENAQASSEEGSGAFFGSFQSLYTQLQHHEQTKQHLPKFSDAVTDLAKALGIDRISISDGCEKHLHASNQGEKDNSKSTAYEAQVAVSERTVTEGTHIYHARQPRQQRGSYDQKSEKENTSLAVTAAAGSTTHKQLQRLLPPLVEKKNTSLHNTRYKKIRSSSRNQISESANQQTESNCLYRQSLQYMRSISTDKSVTDNNKPINTNDSSSQDYHVSDPTLKHEADQFLSQFNKLYSNLLSYRALTPEQQQQLQASAQLQQQLVQQLSIQAEGSNGQEQYQPHAQQSKKQNLHLEKQKQEQEQTQSIQRQHPNRQSLYADKSKEEQLRMTQRSLHHQETLPFTIAPEQVDYRVRQIQQLSGNGIIPSTQYRFSQPHLAGLAHETADEAARKTLKRISAKTHPPDPWEPKKPLFLHLSSSNVAANLDQTLSPGSANQNNTINTKNSIISHPSSTIHCESPPNTSKTVDQANPSYHEKQHPTKQSQQQQQIQIISPTSLTPLNVSQQSTSLKPTKSPYLPQKITKHHPKQTTPQQSALDLDFSIQTIYQQSRAYSLSGKINTKQLAPDQLRLKTDFISEEEEEDFAASSDKLPQTFPEQEKCGFILVPEQQYQ